MKKVFNFIKQHILVILRLAALAVFLTMLMLLMYGCEEAEGYWNRQYVLQVQKTAAITDSLNNSINELYLVADSIKQASYQQQGYIIILENQLATFDSVRDAQTTEMLYSIQEGVDSLVARLRDGRQQWP